MSEPKFTGGPWELIEGTEHHGPYICSPYGTTLCDLYAMSNPMSLSVRNGGDSEPIWFADAAENARLIAAAPELYDALSLLIKDIDANGDGTEKVDIPWQTYDAARAALAKARGEQP